LLQARLELAAGRTDRALQGARELIEESTRSGDAARTIAAKLLEAEVLAATGETVDVKAVGDVLKRAADVIGGESWCLTARLAHLTQNTAWALLADRQLEHLVQGSGERAAVARSFAAAYRERITRPPAQEGRSTTPD
jgi:hypothetical protein